MRKTILASIAVALMLGVASAAAAPLPLKVPQITGDLAKDNAANFGTSSAKTPTALSLSALWQKIVAASAADLTYSKALADSVASPGSKLRSACYGALITANAQANGVNLKDSNGNLLTQPDPHLITSFEQLAEIADNLQPTSPVMSSCAAAANALKVSVEQLITMAVTGEASITLLGAGL